MSLFRVFLDKIKKPHIFYLALALIAGVSIAFIMPPFRGTDEAAHVFRVYELTKGDLILNKGTGGFGYDIPDAIQRVNISGFRANNTSLLNRIGTYYEQGQKKPGDGTAFQTFEGAGLYPPTAYINYLPSSFIARLGNINEYIYILILRISGLLICILMIYAAIRLIPVGKWFIVAIGLLPMSIYQMSVVSADGLLVSSSILFISLVLYVKNNYDQFSRKKWLISSTALLFLALIISSKPGYWPILLLLLIIPKSFRQIFKNKRNRIYPAIILVAIIAFGLWYLLLSANHQYDTRHYFEQVNHSALVTKKQVVKEIINPIALAKRFTETYIIQPPIKNLPLFTLNFQPNFIFNTFIGVFGALEAYMPSWTSITVLGSLIIAILIGPFTLSRKLFGKRERYLAIILWTSSFLLVSLLFWVGWTADNMPIIFGLQGRYFIPILPILVLLIPRKKILSFSANQLTYTLLGLISINVLIMLATIFSFYFEKL